MSEPIHIISIGFGVQSSTIALMADCGELTPRPVAAAFADTMSEPLAVYDWKQWMQSHCTIPIVTVTRGSLWQDSLMNYTSKKSGTRYMKTLIPAFTLSPDGKKGLLGRKCTADYKVALLIRNARNTVGKIRLNAWRRTHKHAIKALNQFHALMKIAKESKTPKPFMPHSAWEECQQDPLVVMWIGISVDEASRMKPSKQPWIRNRWPLIEKNMSRDSCKAWMLSKGYPEPPRSACTFCPFHSDDEWIRLRDTSPGEFSDVVKFERNLQETARNQTALKGIPFLHDSCIPIDQVKFIPTVPGYKQLNMFNNECEGMCGV